ncbi:hypothetical protein CDD81_5770 [Ophiocordyceps australis]|uniref:Uncharacterized protein n=1 Tax=Ophiocordyceps australis TaxID=1399860 RepID=A0A2C5X9T4_9HYPO|nr:hypothetical protein CDD81_5770 [Ophiocordyceps australis]
MKALFFSHAGRRQPGRTSGSLCHPTHPCCPASFSCTCSPPESDAATITSSAATLLDASLASTTNPSLSTDPSLSTLDAAYTTPSVWPVQLDATMMKRGRAKRDAGPASLAACPLSLDSGSLPTRRAATPVQIPGRPHRCKQQRRGAGLAPSLAALLAGTDIPPRVRRRPCSSSPGDDRGRGTQSRPCKAALGEPLIADEYGEAAGEERHDEGAVAAVVHSPGLLDVLLSCPEDEDDESTSGQADGGDSSSSDSHGDSGSMLARTTSADSIPSLGGSSLATEPASSPDGLVFAQRRRTSPARRLLEPVRSPPHAAVEHPLAAVPASDLDDVPQGNGVDAATTTAHDADNDADDEQESKKPSSPPLLENFKPLRSVFKSNLSASLRALRSAAARSLSGFNPPPLPPDDLLTRSILTIDAKVPYADERRPPVCEEVPSAELRRYLNPPTSNRIDFPQPKPGTRRFSASIQMQTYKVQRSRSALSALAAARGHSTPPPPPPPSSPPPPAQAASLNSSLPLRAGGMRQREVRENPDFIRIAVMEMAMRRVGKLDAQRPGRARWALPPRRPASKAYEIGANGVPLRWTPMTC